MNGLDCDFTCELKLIEAICVSSLVKYRQNENNLKILDASSSRGESNPVYDRLVFGSPQRSFFRIVSICWENKRGYRGTPLSFAVDTPYSQGSREKCYFNSDMTCGNAWFTELKLIVYCIL